MISIEPRRTGASSEQAYISAEQPSSPQEARLPAAHAHPGRPGDPVRTAPQGPFPHLGLTARSDRRSSCCRLGTGCGGVLTSHWPSGAVAGPDGRTWWSTCCGEMTSMRCHRSVSSSVASSGARSYATRSGAGCGTWRASTSRDFRGVACLWCARTRALELRGRRSWPWSSIPPFGGSYGQRGVNDDDRAA
jgi:hypothetical protein